MTTFLFDSRGAHIANFVGSSLHSPRGDCIGHGVGSGVFCDLRGRYLGEIYAANRLVYNSTSGHQNTNFGVHGRSNAGSFGNPGRIGAIALPAGYRDVEF